MPKKSKGDAAAAKAAAAERHAKARAENEARKRLVAEQAAAAAAAGLGYSSLQGNRGSMEDKVTARRLADGTRLACVFDGHCGDGCADFACVRMPTAVIDAHFDLPGALERVHEEYLAEKPDDVSGTTSTLAVVDARGVLQVACIGNGRAVLCADDGYAEHLAQGYVEFH